MKLEEIKDNQDYMNNFVFSEEWEHNDEHEFGVVYEQSQPDGEPLKKGAKITLYVSMGQSTIKVPDVYEKSESYAVSELKSKGFKTIIKEIADDEIEAGLVVKTEPARTTVVAQGTEITIFISTGKEIKMVDVPNVVGLTKERAKSDIEKAGLVAKFEDRDLTSDEKFYEKGYVITQNPDPNSSTKVAQGTEIMVYISTGVVNYTMDATVTIPKDYKSDTGKVSLWMDGTLLKEGETIDFKQHNYKYTFKGLTSKEESIIVTLRIDDEKICDIEIDFDRETVTTKKSPSYNYPKNTSSDTESEQ